MSTSDLLSSGRKNKILWLIYEQEEKLTIAHKFLLLPKYWQQEF